LTVAYRAIFFGVVHLALGPYGDVAVCVSASQSEVEEMLGGLGRLSFHLGSSFAESSQEIVRVCLYYHIRPTAVVVCLDQRQQERAEQEQIYHRGHSLAMHCDL